MYFPFPFFDLRPLDSVSPHFEVFFSFKATPLGTYHFDLKPFIVPTALAILTFSASVIPVLRQLRFLLVVEIVPLCSMFSFFSIHGFFFFVIFLSLFPLILFAFSSDGIPPQTLISRRSIGFRCFCYYTPFAWKLVLR